jgi:membrane-associated HD superfamily phosphohydrolase
MRSKQIAERVLELTASGMELQEALETALEEIVVSQSVITDRVAWIKTLTNISDVRKAIKSAHGKKSKAKAEDKKAKYELEIKAGYARLNELIAQAEESESPIKALLEMGETKSSVLQQWLRTREAVVAQQIKDLAGTNKSKKALINKQDPSTPETIKAELAQYGLLELWEERVSRNDLGVITLNRKVRLLESKRK